MLRLKDDRTYTGLYMELILKLKAEWRIRDLPLYHL